MTTEAITSPGPAGGSRLLGSTSVRPVTQLRVLRSEWTKLRSLRSTVYSLLAAVVMVIALGILISAARASHFDHRSLQDRLTFDPTSTSLSGIYLAQLAIGVLGVLVITAEYASGMNRATFAAVPRRLPVLWAKAAVYAVVAFILMVIASFVAFLGGQSALSSHHLQTTLSHPGVLRAVIGAALYLTLVGLLGLALGTLLRNTAGAIATLFGLLLVLPLIVHFLPSSWANDINPYLPSSAGQAVFQVVKDPTAHTLAPWTGFGVFCIYVAVAMIAAAVLLRRRDA